MATNQNQKQNEKKPASPRQAEAKASTAPNAKGKQQEGAKQKKQPGRK